MTDIIKTADEAAEKFHLRDAGAQCCGTCRFFKQEYDADSAPDRGTCWHSRMQGSDDLHGGPLVYPRTVEICDLYSGAGDTMLRAVIRIDNDIADRIEAWLASVHPPIDTVERIVMSWSAQYRDGVVVDFLVKQEHEGKVWIELSWSGADCAQYFVSQEYDDVYGAYYDSGGGVTHELLVLGPNDPEEDW